MAQGTGVEEIEEPNENEEMERWVAVDSKPLTAPHASNKNGAQTIAEVENAELPYVL